jgi:hypothetical protein
MIINKTIDKTLKLQFTLGFKRFLTNSLGILREREVSSIAKTVRQFLLALQIGNFDLLTRKVVAKLISAETEQVFFVSIIQQTEPSNKSPMFRSLKAQTILVKLHAFVKFLIFLERRNLLTHSERGMFLSSIHSWRKYLKKFVTAPKQAALLDVSVLCLTSKYAEYLAILTDFPENVNDKKIAVKIRDAVVGKVASLYGKRPSELSSLSCAGILNPVIVENSYMLTACSTCPSKVTRFYGTFQLFVSLSIWSLLKAYITHVRPVLVSKELSVTEESLLFLTMTGKPMSPKVVGDIVAKTLQSGTSGIRVQSRSIRDTLATLAHIHASNNFKKPQWARLTPAIAESMRHTQKIHDDVYVRRSRPLLLSRADCITESIMSGHTPTDADVEKLTDDSISKAILPCHDSPSTSTPINMRPRHPSERYIPNGNKSTYAYIDELYSFQFRADTHVSSIDIRRRLSEQPGLKLKLSRNLRLENFDNISKLYQRAVTYKNYLVRHNL